MKKVMAIILNYNSIEDSKKCIRLLKQQDYAELLITVVDNNSPDGSGEKLEKFCNSEEVEFIYNYENKGYSAGNNIGLKRAKREKCEYALIINPDVEIKNKKYISLAIKEMENRKNVAVLGTNILDTKNQHQNPSKEIKYWEEVIWVLPIIKHKLTSKPVFIKNPNKSGYCEKISGCCFFIKMEFVEKINYLDETHFLYCEESILAASVKKEGYQEYYLHSLTAYHQHVESEKGNTKNRMDLFLKSRKYYIEKYSGYKGVWLKLAVWSIKKKIKFFDKRIK